MTKNALIVAIVAATLTGCAQNFTPYEVVEQLDINEKTTPRYEVGITEEKKSDNSFVIMTKLSSTSTARRTRDMAFYHAAVLTKQHEYPAFKVLQAGKGSWCSKSRSNHKQVLVTSNRAHSGKTYKQLPTISSTSEDGGYTVRLNVLFLTEQEYQASKTSKKVKLASKVVENLATKINQRPSEDELTRVSEERLQSCATGRKNRKVEDKRFL